MQMVTIYSTPNCPYCVRAKNLFKSKNVAFIEIDLTKEPDQVRIDLMAKTNHRTVPQIFIGETFIGGFDELYGLDKQSKLDPMLADLVANLATNSNSSVIADAHLDSAHTDASSE